MAKDGFLTPKAIANRIKAKGLQKLRYFCQMCEKQCRDDNGFKCHISSESHQRQMAIFAENPGKFIHNFSREFQSVYLSILSSRHGTKRTFANKVYQEVIADRNHLHMNATRWNSLTEFVLHLGREGHCHIDQDDRGWWVSWIDNSPKELARKAAIEKKDRQDSNDEDRQKRLLLEQIEKAKEIAKEKEKEKDEDKPAVDVELKRNDEGPIKLQMIMKKPMISKPMGFKPKSLNALAKASATSTPKLNEGSDSKPAETAKRPLSQAELLIEEDKQRKLNLQKKSRLLH